MNKIRLTQEATEDLRRIKEYISHELKNSAAAVRVVGRITKSFRILQDFPAAGVSLEAKTGYSTDYRMLVSENYLVFYRVNGDIVSIIRVLNGRQDYLRILFGTEN